LLLNEQFIPVTDMMINVIMKTSFIALTVILFLCDAVLM